MTARCGKYTMDHFTAHVAQLEWKHCEVSGQPCCYDGAQEDLAQFMVLGGADLVCTHR